MGCASSKLDDLPAVILCRDRCAFLDEAIKKRDELAEAHMAYIHSLKVIGSSLKSFVGQDLGNSSGSPPSPKLNLPPKRKGDPVVSASIQAGKSPPHHLSRSNSGSHLNFHSNSDDEDDDSGGSLHHSDHSSPLYVPADHIEYMDADQQGQGAYPGGFMHMNYMKNKATPSVVYEERPVSSMTVHRMDMGESSSSTSYYSYPGYSNSVNPNPSPYYEYPNYGGGIGGYYGGGSSPPRYGAMPGQSSPAAAASSSKQPPPPPSPPKASPWEFLNPFENYDKYYSQYTPSRDSKEVREEEGIPDLEDEDYQHEVVKEVHGDQKFTADGGGKHSKAAVVDDEVGDTEGLLYKTRPSVSTEYEAHVVDKKVVDDEERSDERPAYKARAGPRNPFEAAMEIEFEFQRASECGNEISRLLEVGSLQYNRKHVSSKMLHMVTPSLSVVSSQPSTSKHGESSSSADKAGPAQLDFDEDMALRSRKLSSTLRKLYLWEKKLYNEVKAEEKMRVIHDRKCRKLKRLDERGAEAHKVDSTRTLIRSLSTKIRIAIQVVDKVSVTINKIRDEELWPQLDELIQGLTRMWKSMLECHHNQCLAARGLGTIGSGKKLDEAHLDATWQLEHELFSWTSRFHTWISLQKAYVKALNNWLQKCLLYEPEETADGIVPFSPGRLGAPPVFVICNQWSQAMDRISEREVFESMRKLTMNVLHKWEKEKQEMANKDPERKARSWDREGQKIQKGIQALDKEMVLVSGDGNSLSGAGQIVYQSDTSNDSLQASLQRTFEAMERFTANSMKAYEELLQRSEEEKHARDHEGVS
ncbi:hypothetical protein FEM48_Zijuj09G0155100 [Ziziphus jujuba var. spinosa]|uniref:Nitrate regulatory gene2 protein n=1 Tax=Ziziphus jujuba var. spinosa TaxID=714518 RepID=A0A978UTT3_ZIZJJ|nr:hypothetical protein FEM48_Zijuj09G0155100 [Ziziphus jujuba var. spinosa]